MVTAPVITARPPALSALDLLARVEPSGSPHLLKGLVGVIVPRRRLAIRRGNLLWESLFTHL